MAALLMPRRNKGMRTRLGCLSHKSDSCSDFTAILPDKPNRALKRLSTEEATRWADSFDVLLSHKYGVAAFRAFLKTEFSEENLEFWLACEEFKKTRSTAKLVSKAHRIFEEFVDVQAPRENLLLWINQSCEWLSAQPAGPAAGCRPWARVPSTAGYPGVRARRELTVVEQRGCGWDEDKLLLWHLLLHKPERRGGEW
uniref:Regulator of G-protein signaling 8 n=1 Tax=Bos taurus TaxID=9913 RepID=A0AAA9SLI8_BOVIN